MTGAARGGVGRVGRGRATPTTERWADGSFDATARVVDAQLDESTDPDERQVEVALRPKRLDDFPGQDRVREQLSLVLTAAKRRGTPPDHVLLSGPPGLGKTTLAMIVAGELEQPIRITSGPAIQHAGDLASVLSSLAEGEVLFLDEIHRMSRSAEEMLYLAMEDFRVDVIIGKGPGATAIPLELPPFTVVGATTRAGLLPAPLRDRFGFTGHLDYYAAADLVTILHRSARLLGRRRRRGRRARDRAALPRHAPHRQPAAAAGRATGRRCTASTTSTSRPPATPSSSSTSTSGGSTGSTGPSSRRSAAASAGDRWACRPWPSRSGRSPTRSRPSPSPTSCARATWCARRAAGPPPPRPGSTSASRRRATPRACGRRRLPLGDDSSGRFDG